VGTSTSVLVVNAGSSSLKLTLFEAHAQGTNRTLLSVVVSDIGQLVATLQLTDTTGKPQEQQLQLADHEAALTEALHVMEQAGPGVTVAAIGHRIVHGGPRYARPQMLTPQLEQELQALTNYDPDHAPAALTCMALLRARAPHVPQVACFDTGFFHELPRMAQIIPLPREYEAQGVRRYGFHGLSYTYLLSAFEQLAGKPAAKGRIIMAHLGSGASLAALQGGKPVDTTMGFTPASGIVMSSRSGDIDPGVVWYLQRQTGMSAEEFNRVVNFESGLLGVSGLSPSMRVLIENEKTNPHAAEAVELFCYDVRKAIGALTATIGGLDSLIFSGGIGEQSHILRRRICKGLDYLGIELDQTPNKKHADLISSNKSRVGVHVLATNEAAVICEQTLAVIHKK
jgi:acetate kinase